MNAAERRERLLELIKSEEEPISGSALAGRFNVSRQVIVTDIAILKASGNDILATNKGYVINSPQMVERVVKVVHRDDEIGEELNTVVDLGGKVIDVFVWHKIYGKIEAKMNIISRRNVEEYIESLRTGRSSPLKKVTSEYHYHTIAADSEKTLDLIEEELDKKGFLVKDEK